MRGLSGKKGPTPSAATAARLAHHAQFGCTEADLAAVQSVGIRHWLAGQMAEPRQTTHASILTASDGTNSGQNTRRVFPEGSDTSTYTSTQPSIDSINAWFAVKGRDQLRARVAHAFLQFLLVSPNDYNDGNGFAAGVGPRALSNFCDIVYSNALGNYRTMLDQVTRSLQMAVFLTYLNNPKETASSQPDENYAREVMQLFTIGLWELRPNGTRKPAGELAPADSRYIAGSAADVPTYTLDDVRGLARVFTGLGNRNGVWGVPSKADTALQAEPLIFFSQYHEAGSKEFLGVTIPVNTTGDASLTIALDTLFNHPSCAPFIADKLIKFLVTSNPSPAYVARVAAAFASGRFERFGTGQRGSLAAVVAAILLDEEARGAAGLASPTHGRFRDTQTAEFALIRTMEVRSPTNNPISDMIANGVGRGVNATAVLGGTVLHSPSVFGNFNPTYVPPGASVQAPELQGQNAVTVASGVNELTRLPIGSWASETINGYAQWYSLCATPAALVDRLSLLLTADQVSAATKAVITTGITGMPTTTNANKNAMIGTCIGLILSTAEARVQR